SVVPTDAGPTYSEFSIRALPLKLAIDPAPRHLLPRSVQLEQITLCRRRLPFGNQLIELRHRTRNRREDRDRHTAVGNLNGLAGLHAPQIFARVLPQFAHADLLRGIHVAHRSTSC